MMVQFKNFPENLLLNLVYY